MINPYSIVGLDLSLTGTGVASSGGTRTVKSNAKEAIEPRVANIWRNLQDAIGEIALSFDTPSLYIIEGLAFASKTGKVAERCFLHHFVRYNLWVQNKRFVIVPPNSLKLFATGKGNADKDTVLLAVARLWPNYEATNNNESDALALYQMGVAHSMGKPFDVELPKVNMKALEKVEW